MDDGKLPSKAANAHSKDANDVPVLKVSVPDSPTAGSSGGASPRDSKQSAASAAGVKQPAASYLKLYRCAGHAA